MNEQEAEKAVIMRGVQRILNAKPRTMEIIRRYKMSNLKTIERASRCTKDPNPLATSMSIMGMKYPLSLDKELAVKYGVPNVFMPPNYFDKKDFHKYNRVLCKM